jgi:hypothetical protein
MHEVLKRTNAAEYRVENCFPSSRTPCMSDQCHQILPFVAILRREMQLSAIRFSELLPENK